MIRRMHTVAVYVAWVSASMMVTIAGMTVVVTSNWFLTALAKANPGADYTPATVIDVAPPLIMSLGFILIIAAMCGGFRRSV